MQAYELFSIICIEKSMAVYAGSVSCWPLKEEVAAALPANDTLSPLTEAVRCGILNPVSSSLW